MDYITNHIKGIKCDYPSCGFRDDSVEWSPETAEEYLHKSCPKCGAPLLTQADKDAMERMIAETAAINEALVKSFGPATPERVALITRAELVFDGSGNISLGAVERVG